MKVKVNFLDSVMLISIFLFIFYSMFYQHVIGEVNGLLSVVGVIMLAMSAIVTLKDRKRMKNVLWVFLFAFVALVSGMIFGLENGADLFKEMIVSCLKYLLVLYCCYCYIDGNATKLERIMMIICIATFFLSVNAVFNGTEASVYYGGTKTVGELNKNMLSTYITIGMSACVFLFCFTKDKVYRIFLIFVLVIDVIAQFNTASRTGFFAAFIVLIGLAESISTTMHKNKWAFRVAVVVLGIITGLIVLFSMRELANTFVIFDRLNGHNTVGDTYRKWLQSEALKLFGENPLFGKGFGCVTIVCGAYSHSLYYELLASTGIVGSAMLLVPIVKYLLFFYRESIVTSESMRNRLLARMMFWNILLVLVSGITVVYMYYVVFFIYIAIWISAKYIIEK